MKNYNKLPFKERKRHLEYSYNQTERQEELLKKKLIKSLEEEKLAAYREQESKTDKERQEQEAFNRLKALAERNGNGM